MAHITADRVKETSTSTGTGPVVVTGTSSGYVTFASVSSVSDTFYYTIAHSTLDEWEVGTGTYSSANTITRTTVLSSSNANSLVTFSAGSKTVFITAPAGRFVQADAAGNVNVTSGTVSVSGSEVHTDSNFVAGTDYQVPISITTVTGTTHNATATFGTVCVLCDTTANNVTVNLPTAVGNTAIYIIKKIVAANSMIIDGLSTETIDGSATVTIVVENESLTLVSDNTNWKVI